MLLDFLPDNCFESMPLLPCSAAACNPPDPPVDNTNLCTHLANYKPKQKPAKRKGKTKAPSPADSEDPVASANEVDITTESPTHCSTDLPCAGHIEIPPPSPLSHPPRKITATYSHNSDASGINCPMP